MVGPVNAALAATRAAAARRAAMTITAVALLVIAALHRGQAADLPDPMRPPATQRHTAASAAAPAPAAPTLQLVLIGEGRKPSAVINGRLVQLGDAYDEMRLTRLSESSAVLSGPRGQVLLALTPDADKQLEGPPVAKARALPPAVRNPGTPGSPIRVAEHK